ncbi:MAG: hypothetical protein LQ337_000600 [Flavoplaca oasis]|nr:MAG: hypothetical protein LQ337_000600 [Flavoplaca oasis]
MEEQDNNIYNKILTDTVVQVGETLHCAEEPSQPCVICLQTISEQALCKPCKTGVLSVDYGWLSSQGRKSYVVPHRVNQEDAVALTAGDTSTHLDRHTRPTRGYPRPRRLVRPSRPPLSPDAALRRRRQVYAQKLYSLHVGTNRLSRFRDLSPQLFCRDEELLRRARNWIRRELQVFEFLSADGHQEEGGIMRRPNNAEFLLEYIIAILKTVDVKGNGGQAEDMLQEFLGRENTQLFLHELKAWLRSPYISLEDWDRHVQYDESRALTVGRPKIPSRGRGRDASSQLQISNDSSGTQSSNDSSGTQRIPKFTRAIEPRIHGRHNPYPERPQSWSRQVHGQCYNND